jgi:hypothetical protein
MGVKDNFSEEMFIFLVILLNVDSGRNRLKKRRYWNVWGEGGYFFGKIEEL